MKNDRIKLSAIIILMILNINTLFGQLAIINDKDGYVNIRENQSSNSKIIGRVFEGDIFMVANNDENYDWWDVFYLANIDSIENYKREYYKKAGLVKDNKIYLLGFINKSRILLIEDLKYVAESIVRTRNSLLINNDSIDLIFQVSDFNISNHKIEKYKSEFINKIDGENPRGVDGGLPKKEITRISLKINNQDINFPKYRYQDLFEPNLDSIKLHYVSKDTWILSMPYNSDGAGAYFAAWLINKNKITRRYVDSL